MKGDKVRKFIQLAGQTVVKSPKDASDELRRLGAELLLSETLEYVIKGLGIELQVGNQVISDPDSLEYKINNKQVNEKEMLDGLADVAYTMYWNMYAFNKNLEEAFDLVCDNNLEKFVKLDNWQRGEVLLDESEWSLGLNVSWPPIVKTVEVIKVDNEFYAVGKDVNGKVRKPSTYKSVDLESLL